MLLDAFLPIVIVIVLGLGLSRTPLGSGPVWELLERLTYYLFFPALLVLQLSATRVVMDGVLEIAMTLGLALFVLTILMVGLRKFIAPEAAALSSVYQGSIRFNTYIGLAVVGALYGDDGLRLAALCLLVYIPAVNVLSVISLTAGNQDSSKRILVAAGSVVTNPLVLACLLGLLLSEGIVRLPDLAYEVLEIISEPALPLGLLAVGAGIQFIALGQQSWQLLVAGFNKLLAFPALVLAACLLFALPRDLALVLLLLTALPAPPSAFILARQLGGNAPLMANIISLQTVAAFLVIPLWLELGERFL
jgi:predicted permease